MNFSLLYPREPLPPKGGIPHFYEKSSLGGGDRQPVPIYRESHLTLHSSFIIYNISCQQNVLTGGFCF